MTGKHLSRNRRIHYNFWGSAIHVDIVNDTPPFFLLCLHYAGWVHYAFRVP